MKKILLLGLAALSALICTELIVAKVIGYPTYGVEMKMMGIWGLDQPVNIFKPFSKYWTVEGGNKVYRRNNIGLPGINIKISKDSQFIFVLGNSYIEAYQLPPEKIAVSLMQQKLQKQYPEFQVLNLGASGHDPYDLYWRSNYFEQIYSPFFVILVVEAFPTKWLARYKYPLDFSTKDIVPKQYHSKVKDFARLVVNRSAFFNLLSEFLKEKDNDIQERAPKVPLVNNKQKEIDGKMEAAFFECLKNFKLKYGERFSVISIIDNEGENSKIMNFCESNRIQMVKRNLYQRGNRIDGKGHLNAKGNSLLAESLYEAFVKYQKK